MSRLRSLIPYGLLILLTLPILIAYFWLIESSISTRTYGLTMEGVTTQNWSFLVDPIRSRQSIWRVLLSTLMFAVPLGLLDATISSLAGYALSRLKFRGRRMFLSFTIILHAFPSATLLIAIFFVLRFLKLYDSIVGVVLVSVSLGLPLGIWLMKGFFDNVSWDIGRSFCPSSGLGWPRCWCSHSSAAGARTSSHTPSWSQPASSQSPSTYRVSPETTRLSITAS
jgi:inositol-phosphate transport system permease protein